MAISKAKDPSVMMFPSDFLLLLALLREVVDRAHGGHGGLHGGGGGGDGRTSAAAQGTRNSNFCSKTQNTAVRSYFVNEVYEKKLSLHEKKHIVLPFIDL